MESSIVGGGRRNPSAHQGFPRFVQRQFRPIICFREGFQRGYDDGYHGRQKYGRKNDNGGINDEWLIAGGVIAAILGYQLLTD